MSLDYLCEKNIKVVFFGGKGGVGKTTISTSTALHLSEKYKTLLISTDPAHSTASSLEVSANDKIKIIKQSNEPGGSLSLLQVNAESAYDDFMARYEPEIKKIIDTSSQFDDEDIELFIKMPMPGIDEVMGLNVVSDLVKEGEYDRYVIDTAPTGHVLRLLALPDVFDEWIKTMGRLRWKYRYMVTRYSGKYENDDADDFLVSMKKTVNRVRNMISDQVLTSFVVVAVPEGMVAEETSMLINRLRKLNVHVNNIVLNNVAISEGCDFCKNRKKLHNGYVVKLRELFEDFNFTVVPLQDSEVKGLSGLKNINTYLFERS